MTAYTVLDFETTGLFPAKHDRIVEVGVVNVSDGGEVEDQWSTLVNPERDVGPTNIHGIRARDVLHAPTFAQLAPYLLRAVSGRAIVAHNVSFDLRFLTAEFERAGIHLTRMPVPAVCTMRWSGHFLPTASRRLLDCADAVGFDLSDSHQALADAEAAAALLCRFLRDSRDSIPWAQELETCASYPWPVWTLDFPKVTMVSRENSAPARPSAWLDRIVAGMPRNSDAGVDAYLDVLEMALLDRYLAEYEEDVLVETALGLGVSRDLIDQVHRDYLRAMARVALADGVVTSDERADLDRVAELLGLKGSDVDAALALAPSRVIETEFSLRPGDCVCLTGDMSLPRSEWESLAATKGLLTGGLTKRTRVLVAADPDSASGKATKARAYGIPIITEQAFERLLETVRTDTHGESPR